MDQSDKCAVDDPRLLDWVCVARPDFPRGHREALVYITDACGEFDSWCVATVGKRRCIIAAGFFFIARRGAIQVEEGLIIK
jgi:hypothetical protein